MKRKIWFDVNAWAHLTDPDAHARAKRAGEPKTKTSAEGAKWAEKILREKRWIP